MTKQTKNATKNQTTIPHSTMTETPQHPVEMKDDASQLEAKIIPLFEEVTQNFASAVPNEIMLSEQEEYRLASFWHNRIKEAQKVYEPYYQMIKKARQFYKTGSNLDTTGLLQSALSESGFNIFWSSIETQKPFLYFKQPKPYVERLSWNATPAERVAAKILERALTWNLNKFDFDSVLKYARNDYLISGCGILFESYQPSFQTEHILGQEITLKTDEKVVSTYVDPLNFLMDTAHAGIFEDVTWIARRIPMQLKDIETAFGEKAVDMFAISTQNDEQESPLIDVYEIWDKDTRRVYYFAPTYPSAFLKIQSDPLHLEGFFPIPKPIFSTLTTDSLIPQPDFQMIEKILEELKGVTDRMRLLMQAIKISGVYDTSFMRLKDIFDKDVTLVGLHDFDRLKESGGLNGVIDFIPIQQYILGLEVLAKRRDELKTELFEITGVSDIMRGMSNKVETATAVEKKTGFGTLRNQDRQNDMQRFIQNIYQIKAEIICEQFDDHLLKSFVSTEEGYSLETLAEAIAILKTGKLRNMVLSIETEAFFKPEDEAKKITQAVDTISKLITQGIGAVANEHNLLPLYKEMILQTVNALPHARQFENVIEQSFTNIAKALEKEETETSLLPSLLSNQKKMVHQQQLDMLKQEIQKAELMLKQKELLFREKELFYKTKKAELDFYETLYKGQVEGQKSWLRHGKGRLPQTIKLPPKPFNPLGQRKMPLQPRPFFSPSNEKEQPQPKEPVSPIQAVQKPHLSETTTH